MRYTRYTFAEHVYRMAKRFSRRRRQRAHFDWKQLQQISLSTFNFVRLPLRVLNFSMYIVASGEQRTLYLMPSLYHRILRHAPRIDAKINLLNLRCNVCKYTTNNNGTPQRHTLMLRGIKFVSLPYRFGGVCALFILFTLGILSYWCNAVWQLFADVRASFLWSLSLFLTLSLPLSLTLTFVCVQWCVCCEFPRVPIRSRGYMAEIADGNMGLHFHFSSDHFATSKRVPAPAVSLRNQFAIK